MFWFGVFFGFFFLEADPKMRVKVEVVEREKMPARKLGGELGQ